MNKKAKILGNVFSNWTGFGVNALVMFLLTPFVLARLGVEQYGIWVLINSLIGYYGLLDLGLRSGINQYLIRSLAARNYSDANVVLSSALAALAVLAAVIVVLTIVAANLVPQQLEIAEHFRQSAFTGIMIVGFAAAAQILLSPFASCFVALQRFDLLNAIAISARLLTALLTVACLNFGYGLVGLAAAAAIGTVLGGVLQTTVAKRLLPSIRISKSLVALKKLGEIGSFGLWNFLISMTDYVYIHLLPLTVAALMPIAAVGHYALVAGIWMQINLLFTPIGQVLYPVAAELHVGDERSSLKRLYVDGTRIYLLVVIPVVTIAFTWADDFYRLWVGGEYLTGDPFVSLSTLLRIMLIGTVIGYSANIASQILVGSGKVRAVATAKSIGALTAVVIAVSLIRDMGLIAVAVSIAIAIFFSDVVGLSVAINRNTDFNLGDLLRSATIRLVAAAMSISASCWIIRSLFSAGSWVELMLQGAMAGFASLAIVVVIGLRREERNELIREPLRALFRS